MEFYYSKKHDKFLYKKITNDKYNDICYPGSVDNITEFMEGKDSVPILNGDPMELFVPNTTDASLEKHVPVVKKDGAKVEIFVGEVAHPMQDVHFIEWISIETNKGFQVKYLNPEDKPEASFLLLEGEELVAAYAYCNLHGLWKA